MNTQGHRRSIRLQHYDYAQHGAYFVTLCSYQRACIFGEITGDSIRLSDIGTIIEDEWLQTERIRAEVSLDEYVIMPNHFHAIIVLENTTKDDASIPPTGAKPKSIGAIIQGFKSIVTSRVKRLEQMPEIKIWQRNYYEHIIRNEGSLNKIREYIRNNPAKWAEDKENPVNTCKQSR